MSAASSCSSASSPPEMVDAPPPKTNAWGVTPTAASGRGLTEVMSEQLASDLAEKEEERAIRREWVRIEAAEAAEAAAVASAEDGAAGGGTDSPTNSDDFVQVVPDGESDDCKDDLLIAQMLQMQFDQEYDQALSKEEAHQNGSSKVSVNYSKYKVIPDNPAWEEDSDEDEYFVMDDRKRHVDYYETAEKELGPLPKCGYRRIKSGQIVTKHDKQISQRSNGKRMMDFPSIATGDGGGLDVQLSNPVYNEIRNFSIKENKRKNRVKDKVDKSTVSQAVDPATRLILFKMVNNGLLSAVNGVVSTGKEAVILHAEGGVVDEDGDADAVRIPEHCAVKVFKTSLNEFKTRDKYIKDDMRFRDRFGKQNPRKIVHIWAEKEMHNLCVMRRAGVAVPEPVVLKKHVLVMQMVGTEDGTPSPKIKDAALSSNDLDAAYGQVESMMTTLYNKCRLVHADLSEYNILWHADTKQCFLIDVSQSVEPNHPHGLEFLMRDCRNVADFFGRRKGVRAAKTAEELFTHVTGLKIDPGQSEADAINQVRQYEKDDRVLRGLEDVADGGLDEDPLDGKDAREEDLFEYRWEKSKNGGGADGGTQAVPIPGSARGGKSGRVGGSTGKSPRSYEGKSKSPRASLAGVSDRELKRLKDELVQKEEDDDLTEEPRSAPQVTFKDQEE